VHYPLYRASPLLNNPRDLNNYPLVTQMAVTAATQLSVSVVECHSHPGPRQPY
jgi:hypothetical protein